VNVGTRTRGLLQALLLTAAYLGLAAPQVAEAYEDGWRNCAEEGQTCSVTGRAVVRYGVDGRWVSRTVSNGVECGNDAFGDPAPQVPKRCQVRVSGYNGSGSYPGTARGWSFCAAEGEVCRFKGMAEVRFGQGNSFVTRTAYGSIRCDVADFGDPIYGVTKFCEVRHSGNQAPENSTQGSWAGAGSSNGGWRYCAAENATCRVQGTAQVRFGDGRAFRTRTVRGEVDCSVRTFGDPAYGRLKHCEVEAGSLPAGGSSGWTRCATEGERCVFSGYAQVRYGLAGRYVYRDGNNGVMCGLNGFGDDPYPGRVKVCEIRR
jgi:hypothetical protein